MSATDCGNCIPSTSHDQFDRAPGSGSVDPLWYGIGMFGLHAIRHDSESKTEASEHTLKLIWHKLQR